MSNEKRGLARFVNIPGGITEKDAENFADLRLQFITPKALAEIDGACMQIERCGKVLRADPDAIGNEELQSAAYSLASIAGMFGKAALGRAAHSLCVLLDIFEEMNLRDDAAIQVHLDTIKLLHDGACDAQSEALQAGLDRVVLRFKGANE